MSKTVFPTAYLAIVLPLLIGIPTVRAADDAPLRVDRHGDPLPAGAIARLGTICWRQSSHIGSGFTRISFSSDGKFLASTGNSGLGLWEVSTGKPLSWSPDNAARVRAASFSPDGKTLSTQTYRQPDD